MSVTSSLLAGFYRLPPAEFGVSTTRHIAVPALDGTPLMTDLFRPRTETRLPTLLMRLPYGRSGFDTVAEAYAERGYNTVLQACRGTGGSGGVFDPLTHERQDGLATIDWIKAQDWFDGRLGTSGPSYLGYAQWAICDAPEIGAMATKVSSAEFESVVFPGGAFALQLWLSWLQTVEGLRGAPLEMSINMMTGEIERRTKRAAGKLPLMNGDVETTGHQVPFWRHWLVEAIDNPAFWAPLDHRPRLGPKTPPNSFVSGWYDFMLTELLRDYRTLVDCGHTPYLTIGTWHHIHNDLQAESIRQTLSWMDARLRGRTDRLRTKPVRLHLSGGPGWRDFDTYPPQTTGRTLYLGSGGALNDAPSDHPGKRGYTYDPADPTPNVGGAVFAFTGAGPRDNRPLEARKDVLVFSTPPLEHDLTIVGAPEITLFVHSDCAHTDFFARLCDVSRTGRSTNICDRLERLHPGRLEPDADGIVRLTFRLHPSAHRFRRANRIRLLVSSGAHPRFARNLGTGDPIGTATEMVVQHQQVFCGGPHPSSLTLPVWRET